MKVRTDTKRASIVETAAELFLELGYERTSMNELAKRLGGSKTTLYGYFESKEQLFEAVVRTFATGHLAEAAHGMQVNHVDVTELQTTLLRFAERMLRVLTDDARAMACYRMVLAEAGRSNVGQMFYEAGPSEAVSTVAEVLGAAMKQGILAKHDSLVRAHQLLALITAEIQPRLYDPEPSPMERPAIRRLTKRAVDMFLGGALPR
ncbi:TetR family transcriptional regulator [Luteibacter rhizovicinus]|uniref:TetR family transcriptional regulator n=1 Tax=Luteibacter rhizovicinus TaxID=242606 RepID=A0A4R3YTX9_9GAMM|nr:TetR/AcrR family transcriptional regulator [Luteibacter rhizovicinus]TCV96417.1 TetR family transcriptional regulator [Luteibacter rhizovicinus]